jgi:hypothetical protein
MRKAKFGIRWIKANAYVFVALALVAATLSIVFPFGVAQAGATINGKVFLDHHQNGALDKTGTVPNLAVDKGVEGSNCYGFRFRR